MKEVRVGIIGIGNMGSAHAVNIFDGKVQNMHLSAVCDTDPKKLEWAKENLEGVSLYQNYKEMYASGEIDAVVIATPHKLHPIMTIEAFKQGLHVLTEKPAGVEISSVRKMNEAAKKSGKVFGIMYNQRTNPLFSKLKAMVEDGSLGEIKRMVWIITNWYRTQSYYDSGEWRATWDGEGGGVLLNQCPHNLDIWQWIMGIPVKVQAHCQYGRYHQIAVEDDVTIWAEYENGATASFITSTGEYPGTNRLEISGTKGKVIIENGALKWYAIEKDEREICVTEPENTSHEPVIYRELVPEEKETAHLGILQNFTDAILEGKSLLAPGEEGIFGLSISNAAYLSDWTGQAVKLPMTKKAEALFDKLLKEHQLQETEKKASLDKTAYGKKVKRPEGVNSLNCEKGIYEDRWSVRW